jgi:small subunit ribosomal protein S6e
MVNTMVEFKANISDPKTGKTYKTVVSGHHANSLIGKGIGDEFDGIFVGLPGYKLFLTGGSDKEGFPMRRDLSGTGRRKIMIAKSSGFRAKLKQKKKKPVNTEAGRFPMMHGVRKRKSVRGNTISAEIIQINMRITSYGPKEITEMLKIKEEQQKAKEQKK